MTATQMMELINSHYVVGCVDFYNKQDPNPWMQAHEDWYSAIATNSDWDIKSKINDVYAKRILKLIRDYHNLTIIKPFLNYKDAFMLGSEERYKKVLSQTFQECYLCDTDKGLKIRLDHDGRSFVICSNCELRKTSRYPTLNR